MTNDTIKEGWVYCISNECMPGLLKIGMTDRTPQQRLAEANRADTWRPPIDFKIEFAKKVNNALQKEKTLHKLLEQYNERVNRSREFFRITVEKARLYFDLMDGIYWDPPKDEVIAKEKPVCKRQKKNKNSIAHVEENIIVYPSETPPEPTPKQKQKQKPSPQINKNLRPNQIKLDGLTVNESLKLLSIAQERYALEIKVNNKHHTFNDIMYGSVVGQLHSNMIFTPMLMSPDNIITVVSANLESSIEQISKSAPKTFLYAEQKDLEQLESQDMQITNDQYELIINANIKDLTTENGRTLLTAAFNTKSLAFKIGKRFYRFHELKDIKPHKLKRTVYEARVAEAPDGISSIDEDAAFFVSKSNYTSILKTLKDTSRKHIIIVSELAKM